MTHLAKKLSKIILFAALPLAVLAGFFVIPSRANAAPVITFWSSVGGTTTNKNNDQDIMCLAEQGDSIIFSITATGSTSYTNLLN